MTIGIEGAGEFETKIASRLGEDLASHGGVWKVELQPDVAGFRPDIMVESPTGDMYVVDIKPGESDVHVSSLQYLKAVGSHLPGSSRGAVHLVLVSGGRVTSAISDLSEDWQVTILRATDNVADTANAIANYVTEES